MLDEVNQQMEIANLILFDKCWMFITFLLHQRMQELVDRLQNKVSIIFPQLDQT